MDVPPDDITPIAAFLVMAIALIILCMKQPPANGGGWNEGRCCHGQTNEARQRNFARAQKHP